MPEGIVIMWDHRDQPSWDEVTAAARRGFTFFKDVEHTGSDMYAVVATRDELLGGEEEAEALFNAIMEEEDRL